MEFRYAHRHIPNLLGLPFSRLVAHPAKCQSGFASIGRGWCLAFSFSSTVAAGLGSGALGMHVPQESRLCHHDAIGSYTFQQRRCN